MLNIKFSPQNVVLLIAGLILIIVGISITASPAGFYANNAIDLGNNASLISELRAPAGMLIVVGVFVLAGIFSKALTRSALQISSMLYLSYGIARAFGMFVEGMPHASIVSATVIELVIGSLCLLMLIREKNLETNALVKGA